MGAGFAVFDLDGTLTSSDTYKRFLRARLRAKPWRLAHCVPLAWHYRVAVREGRDHIWLKQKALRAIAGGSRRDELLAFAARYAADVVADDVPQVALSAIAAHRQAGDQLVLCSASFDFYVEAIGDALGFDHVICTRAAWQNDRLVGDIDGINCFGDEKIRRLDAVVGSGERGTVTAYTDHHSDQPLLDWADKPVAVSPTRHMREAAKSKGYAVEDWHAKAAFGG